MFVCAIHESAKARGYFRLQKAHKYNGMFKFRIKAEYHQKLSRHETSVITSQFTCPWCFTGRWEGNTAASAIEIRLNF